MIKAMSGDVGFVEINAYNTEINPVRTLFCKKKFVPNAFVKVTNVFKKIDLNLQLQRMDHYHLQLIVCR